jgi:hypothetical protein
MSECFVTVRIVKRDVTVKHRTLVLLYVTVRYLPVTVIYFVKVIVDHLDDFPLMFVQTLSVLVNVNHCQ